MALSPDNFGRFSDALLVGNFGDGKIHAYAGFVDPKLPAGYAPFGIQNINDTLYVTYALQDEDAEDDVAGVGHGYIDVYDTAGKLLRRVASFSRVCNLDHRLCR